MIRLWKIIFASLMGFVLALFLLPTTGYAVEYSITNVKIDAFLQENGDVKVKETHTYSFEGDFNGITRELDPKQGAKITDFEAVENGEALKIEMDDGVYKIHRKGSDETITVELMYSIENGVDVYEDVAEFYWPFFDERNESAYEKLSVVVYPPKATENPIAFGYDEAFETEKIQNDGTVLFQFGEVPAYENGDIRVAYDAALFSSASLTSEKSMKGEILGAKQELIDEAVARAKTKELLATIAVIMIPVVTVVLVVLIIIGALRARLKKAAVQREVHAGFFVPKQVMSLPATIYYTSKKQLTGEVIAAAFLDLLRQGYVKRAENDLFELGGNWREALKHERILIDFLFHEVGSDGQFYFDDLSAYTRNKKNHQRFHSNQLKWMGAWTAGFLGILLLPFLFLFPIYGLFTWFMAAIVLFGAAIIYAISYKPRTWDGLRIIYEWQMMKAHMKELPEVEWSALSEDDRARAYIYALGINDKGLIEKNEELVESFRPPPRIA